MQLEKWLEVRLGTILVHQEQKFGQQLLIFDRRSASTIQFPRYQAIRNFPDIGYFLRSWCAKIGNVDFQIPIVDI